MAIRRAFEKRATTIRRRPGRTLVENEEGFRVLFSANPLPMWVYDLETLYFLEVNYAAVKHYGYSRDEFLKLRITDIRPSEDIHLLNENLAQKRPVLDESGSWRHRQKDGRLIQVQITSHIVEWNGRKAALVVAQDVTERERYKDALLTSEGRFRSLVENATIGVYRTTRQGQFVMANPAMVEMLGYKTFEELAANTAQGRQTVEMFPLEEYREQTDRRGKARVIERLLTRQDGSTVFVRERWRAVQGEDGEISHYDGIVEDITEQKRIKEALLASEQRYQDLFENAHYCVFTTDLSGHYTAVNRCTERLTGYDRHELIGMSCLDMVASEYIGTLRREMMRLAAGSDPSPLQLEIVTKSGHRVPVEVSRRTIYKDGEPAGFQAIAYDIMARKRAEEALRASEARFRQMAESNMIGVIVGKSTGEFTYVNDAYLRMVGYTREDFEAGRLRWDALIPADQLHIPPMIGKQLDETGIVTPLETVHLHKDGRRVPVLMGLASFAVGRDEAIGFVLDLTERKQAEETLREYERVVQGSQDMIAVVDTDYRYRLVNDAFLSRHEMTREQVLGKQVSEVFSEVEFETVIRRHLEESFRGKNVQHEMKRAYSTVGERTLLVSYFPIEGDTGISRIACVLQDVTERVNAEAENRRLVAAIEQSAEAVVITNTKGEIEYANWALTRMTGYSRQEVLGKTPRILKSGKQDREFYEQLWSTLLNGSNWHGEITNRRKDGSLYIEEMNIGPVRNSKGVITHFIASKQDITERKALEGQLHQKAKLEAVGQLADGVAHDFNNLLTIISGYGQMLQGRVSQDDLPNVEEILKASDRAASLTRQLLAFSRRQMLAPEVLDLNAVVSNMEKMLRRLISENIELISIQQPGLGHIKADPGQIEQVIINLVVNARDAMPQGGTITVETANVELDECYVLSHPAVSPGPYVMVAVSDTGRGMNAVTLARIFDPFFTTKEKGKGTGLGLSTVYGIVKQSGGTIWAYSEPGHGSTMKAYFPRVEGTVASHSKSGEASAKTTGSETILLVEDEDAVRLLLRNTFARHGYTVLEAADGEQALTELAKFTGKIDLLVTDVVMPRMNGRELAEHVSGTHPEAKVLYMSGYTDNVIVKGGILQGGTAFIQKPLLPNVLLRKIREQLDAKSKEC